METTLLEFTSITTATAPSQWRRSALLLEQITTKKNRGYANLRISDSLSSAASIKVVVLNLFVL